MIWYVDDQPLPTCPKCDAAYHPVLDRIHDSAHSPIAAFICPGCHQEIWTYEPLEDTNAK